MPSINFLWGASEKLDDHDRFRQLDLTEDGMAITVVWETWLKSGAEAEGLRLTRQVWSDMRAFEGYVSHELLVDQDTPGHIIVLGRWRSRDDADQVRERYPGGARSAAHPSHVRW
jgi:quinol monooxygenase YgiN